MWKPVTSNYLTAEVKVEKRSGPQVGVPGHKGVQAGQGCWGGETKDAFPLG